MTIPKRFEALISGEPWLTSSVGVNIEGEWDQEAYEYRIVKLAVHADKDGDQITSELIRDIPVGQLFRSAIRRAVLIDNKGWRTWQVFNSAFPPEELARLVKQGPKPETLRRVSQLYRVAKMMGEPPAGYVTAVFGIPPRTASHWIKLARERGYLDVDDLVEEEGEESSDEYFDDDADRDSLNR